MLGGLAGCCLYLACASVVLVGDDIRLLGNLETGSWNRLVNYRYSCLSLVLRLLHPFVALTLLHLQPSPLCSSVFNLAKWNSAVSLSNFQCWASSRTTVIPLSHSGHPFPPLPTASRGQERTKLFGEQNVVELASLSRGWRGQLP